MHLPSWIGAIPGFSALATRMMTRTCSGPKNGAADYC